MSDLKFEIRFDRSSVPGEQDTLFWADEHIPYAIGIYLLSGNDSSKIGRVYRRDSHHDCVVILSDAFYASLLYTDSVVLKGLIYEALHLSIDTIISETQDYYSYDYQIID